MKNKVKLKKFLIILSCVICLLLSVFLTINIYEYRMYNKNFNIKIASIINVIEQKYPNITDEEIVEIFKNDNFDNKLFENYSIDLEDSFLIKNNELLFFVFILINVLFYVLTIVFIIYYFLSFNKKKDNEIKKITAFIEQINNKNYQLDLDNISEDELSILKNEIYKTMINLKEMAELSSKDKNELKKSLSDISHQLKTPLTSILIILDNVIDDPDMDVVVRNGFIKDIKREIMNINFLIQSLLKLSKIDTNSIVFVKENIFVSKVVSDVIEKLSFLSDLKKVSIRLDCDDDIIIKGDYKWEVEAITNIVKNCVEYAFSNTIVDISVSDNKVYTQIVISDNGMEIDSDDIKYIFERFYKGKNSSSESIGIGLSLAKSIINKDNGVISVESNNNLTKFIIKYYK